jgi:mono/diheme cytochrome c family protein
MTLLPCLLSGMLGLLPTAPARPRDRIDFNRDIRPILSENCYTCHGPDASRRKAGLRLDRRADAFRQSEPGVAAVVPGDRAHSLLFERISAHGAGLMPPARTGKKLTPAQIELLGQWIDQGARWDPHWAYVPPRRPSLPPVADGSWARMPIDRFILARLEKEGLRPSPEADRATLIRRVSLDLTGLPPSPAEVDGFLADDSPSAYEKVVDRLLASPHFGERLAQPWLDLARYADTNGFRLDNHRDVWRWRDWVIEAFNRNMPFDQFTIEQLAGDLLPGATTAQKIATGFHRNTMVNFGNGSDPKEYHAKAVMDRVATTATVWLGTTMGCAQCHNHKYDPISQKDFYRLYAFFNNVPEKGLDGERRNPVPALLLPSPEQARRLAEVRAALQGVQAHLRAALEQVRLEAELFGLVPVLTEAQAAWEKREKQDGASKLPKAVLALVRTDPAERDAAQNEELTDYFLQRVHPTTSARFAELNAEHDRLKADEEKLLDVIPSTPVMEEMATPRITRVFQRGDYQAPGEVVTPGVPASLPPLPAGAPANRLGLARWLVDGGNPLTARVTVNRYWQMLFGTGLVKTGDDFGAQGEAPSHPELLDWLAVEFVARGWDVKAILRTLVTSATYRQSSRLSATLRARDPENRLLARGPRFRLDAEQIRDNALAISGLLVRQVGGPSVKPYQPSGLWEQVAVGGNYSSQSYMPDSGPALYRRGLYTYWKRSMPPPALVTFDAPARELCTAARPRTNTPLQALVLMNDPVFLEAARALAERTLREAAPDRAARLTYAFRLCTGRLPGSAELDVLTRTCDLQRAHYRRHRAAAAALVRVGETPLPRDLDVSELAAWTATASLLLNLDETITRE